jgi:3',5'-cyclic AMP phosphodiesterase CpdA
VDTNSLLEQAVAHLNRLDPPVDIVLVTGDLTDKGQECEYQIVQSILSKLTMPYYLLLGNHDNLESFRKVFSNLAYAKMCDNFLHYTIDNFPIYIICLDSTVLGAPGGTLCKDRLEWLEEKLRVAPNRRTMIAMHHPPVSCGISHMDCQRLDNPDAFGEIIARHSQIERILCGHVHRPIQVRWNTTTVSIAPSVAHQIVLDLRDNAQPAFNLEPPACHLHVLCADGGLVTHTSYIGKFPGPYSDGDW